MDFNIFMVVGIIAVVLIAGYVGLIFFNKSRMGKLFEQIYQSAKQVPKQKKNSFVLLMLVETISSSRKGSKTTSSKLNNQKYIEFQMIQMSRILNKSVSPPDKRTKQALKMLSNYQNWEASKKVS